MHSAFASHERSELLVEKWPADEGFQCRHDPWVVISLSFLSFFQFVHRYQHYHLYKLNPAGNYHQCQKPRKKDRTYPNIYSYWTWDDMSMSILPQRDSLSMNRTCQELLRPWRGLCGGTSSIAEPHGSGCCRSVLGTIIPRMVALGRCA